MIINYRYKDTDLKLFFLNKMLKIKFIFYRKQRTAPFLKTIGKTKHEQESLRRIICPFVKVVI